MNRKILAVLLCMLFAVTVPVATAMAEAPQEEDEATGIFSRTRVTGLILGSKSNGLTTSFTALFVSYKTNNLIAEDESGILILKRVTFMGKFTGYMGQLFVCGSFRGSV